MIVNVTRFVPGGAVDCGGAEMIAVPLPAEGWLWVDIEGEGEEVDAQLREFGFHPLAIEDALTYQHQPKVEEFEDFLFVIVRGIDFNKTAELDTLKLAVFVQERRIVTVHRAPLRSVQAVRQRLDVKDHSPIGGPIRLLHGLCDQIVDYYFPVVDGIGDELEELERAIFEKARQSQLQTILDMRRRLAVLRRVMLPHRQVFNHLAHSETAFVDESTALYFRDVYDNVLRLVDASDQQRDQMSSAKDTYLSVVSQKTNEVMKVLTLFSAILLPVTFIAGVYGMNFDNMPELRTRYGYYGTLAGMLAVASGLFLWFRKRGWW
jgi:magnesium transporter